MKGRKEKQPGSLTLKHWMGYMFGDFGGCMTFALMASVFTMYCTNALGVDPIRLGTLVIIWTIWDAVNDPMMGALMDKAFARRQNKNGSHQNTCIFDHNFTTYYLSYFPVTTSRTASR